MPDGIAAFYLICFLVGLVFVLLSAAIGYGQDLAHLPGIHIGSNGGGGDAGHGGGAIGQADAGDAGAGSGDAPAADAGAAHAHGAAHGGHAGDGYARSAATASPLNLMTVMAFLTWFGGVGYVLHVVYGALLPLSLVAGFVAGALAGWLVYLLLVKVLLPGSAVRDARQNQLVGNLGRVSISIAEGGVGEVIYTMDDSRHSDGARSVDGLPIPAGTEVVIVRFERGIAYVQPWDRFVAERSGKLGGTLEQSD